MSRGAPAKKPRRNARELATSRPPPENLSARTDRVRTATKQVCKKWTLTFLQVKFPVTGQKFPVPQNIFPVNFRRELSEKGCSTAASCYGIASQSPKNAKFPVKFPVSREFAWRRVRSALRRQPTSPAPGDFTLSNLRNARQWRAFANWRSVSRPPPLAPSRTKSP